MVKGVAGAGEGVGGQGKGRAVDGGLGLHAALAAVGPVIHGVGVGHPPGVDGLAVGGQLVLRAHRAGEGGVQIPLHGVVAGAGVLLVEHLRVHCEVRDVGQDQSVQMVVGRHEAAVLQRRVAAHVQGGELVVVDVQELQLFQHGAVKAGEAVVEGLDEHQLQVAAHVQLGEGVVAAVELHQLRVAGKVQLGEPVALAVQVHQFRAAGHVQLFQGVGGAVQRGQPGVFAHIQAGEPVVVHVQPFQRGEMADAGQVTDAQAGEVQHGDLCQFPAGEHAVGAHAVQVAFVQQPAAKDLVGEIRFIDVHVLPEGEGARRQGQRQGQRDAESLQQSSHEGSPFYVLTRDIRAGPHLRMIPDKKLIVPYFPPLSIPF